MLEYEVTKQIIAFAQLGLDDSVRQVESDDEYAVENNDILYEELWNKQTKTRT